MNQTLHQQRVQLRGKAPTPYVVVIGPGTGDEQVIGEFATLAAALAYVRQNRDWCGVDVMKRLPDGSLTTEL